MIDEEEERIEVVVPDEQLSLAIGRRGQNVRLASQLTGWEIDILTEAEEASSARRNSPSAPKLFMKALDVDEMLAQLLVVRRLHDARGSRLCRSRRTCRRSKASTRRRPTSCRPRAREHLDKPRPSRTPKRKALGVEDRADRRAGPDEAMLVTLGKAGIKTLDDFAGSPPDELTGWFEHQERRAQRGIEACSTSSTSRARGAGDGDDRPGHGGLGDERRTCVRRSPTPAEAAPDAAAAAAACTDGRAEGPVAEAKSPERKCIVTGETSRRTGWCASWSRLTARSCRTSGGSCPAAASMSRRPAADVATAERKHLFAKAFDGRVTVRRVSPTRSTAFWPARGRVAVAGPKGRNGDLRLLRR